MKDNNWILIAGAIILIGVFYFLSQSAVQNSVNAHAATPADISKGTQGTGLTLRFYDSNGNPIPIPDWFSSAPSSGFTIVKHASPPACTTVSNCVGYATNPNIRCYNSQCVLGNIAAMDMGINVVNPGTSQLSFLNLIPSNILPTALDTVFNKSVIAKLSPNQTASWQDLSPVSVGQWEGTTQIFKINVTAQNEFTGATISTGDSLSLTFAADPTGSLSVSIASVVP